jgi:hypothetical protein
MRKSSTFGGTMNLLPAALILGAVASGSVLAQQKDNAIPPQGQVPLPKIQSVESLQPGAPQPGLQDPNETGQSSTFSQGSGRVLVPGVRFVVRDGAVYLTLFEGGALVPMAGGGASGCFGVTFPPKLSMVTLRPLNQHTPALQGLYIYVR